MTEEQYQQLKDTREELSDLGLKFKQSLQEVANQSGFFVQNIPSRLLALAMAKTMDSKPYSTVIVRALLMDDESFEALKPKNLCT